MYLIQPDERHIATIECDYCNKKFEGKVTDAHKKGWDWFTGGRVVENEKALKETFHACPKCRKSRNKEFVDELHKRGLKLPQKGR